MKKLLFVVIVSLLAFNGCSKSKTSSYLDFTPEDITSVTIKISTSEETEILDERSKEGIKEFIRLIKKIDIKEEIDKDTQVKDEDAEYYQYTFYLTDGGKISFVDYQDQLEVIDHKNNVHRYEISTNTWEGLTELWTKYYVSPNMYQYQDQEPVIEGDPGLIKAYKPVIYLYPEKPTAVTIQMELNGVLNYTYPEYQSGWEVLAYPDGTLRNRVDDITYSYLFWEGMLNTEFDMSNGFVVEGSDTTKFLEEKLSYLGLNSKEMNDFIVYWAPEMTANPYNLICFIQEEYLDNAKLSISPEPDSMLRIFMAYQPLEEYLDVPEQDLVPWEREGFSVVEWGGTSIFPKGVPDKGKASSKAGYKRGGE